MESSVVKNIDIHRYWNIWNGFNTNFLQYLSTQYLYSCSLLTRSTIWHTRLLSLTRLIDSGWIVLVLHMILHSHAAFTLTPLIYKWRTHKSASQTARKYQIVCVFVLYCAKTVKYTQYGVKIAILASIQVITVSLGKDIVEKDSACPCISF